MSNAHNSSQTPLLRADNRSPFLINAPGTMKDELVTSPDVGKVGEGLAERALSAHEHLKSRLKTEQYGKILYETVYQRQCDSDRHFAV